MFLMLRLVRVGDGDRLKIPCPANLLHELPQLLAGPRFIGVFPVRAGNAYAMLRFVLALAPMAGIPLSLSGDRVHGGKNPHGTLALLGPDLLLIHAVSMPLWSDTDQGPTRLLPDEGSGLLLSQPKGCQFRDSGRLGGVTSPVSQLTSIAMGVDMMLLCLSDAVEEKRGVSGKVGA